MEAQQFAGDSAGRREINDEFRDLKTGRRQLKWLIARHMRLPGRKGEVDASWDDDVLFDDDFDEFADRP